MDLAATDPAKVKKGIVRIAFETQPLDTVKATSLTSADVEQLRAKCATSSNESTPTYVAASVTVLHPHADFRNRVWRNQGALIVSTTFSLGC